MIRSLRAKERTSALRTSGVSLVAAVLCASLLASPSAPASAATPSTGEQTWEIGTIQRVSDGDTVVVNVTSAVHPALIAPPLPADPAQPVPRSFCFDRANADGTMPSDGELARCRVRLAGIQAPESKGAAGSNVPDPIEQCGASAAESTLAEQLPPGTVVQLRSLSPRSAELDYSGGRLVRTVYYRNSAGTWVDAAREVFRRGQAMWFPFSAKDPEKPEYVHNLEYRRLVDRAAASRLGLFWPNACGRSAPVNLRTWVVWDPPGSDENREHVVLRNDGPGPLDVSRWVVRDSSLTYATLPPGTVIAPGDFIRVWSGRGAAGTPTARDFYFNGSPQMFANFDPDQGYFSGDSVYVFDAQPGVAIGNLRAWSHYPCDPAACVDRLSGIVDFGEVQYDPKGADTAAGEYVDITNTTSRPVDLGGYAFARRGLITPFSPHTAIAPYGRLRIKVGTGVDGPDVFHLGRTSSLLGNSGDRLTLINLDGRVVDCRAWGSFTCKGFPVSGKLERAGAPVAKPARPPATGKPTGVHVSQAGRRLAVTWPKASVSAKVQRVRAKFYRQVLPKKGATKTTATKWRHKSTCSASAKKLTCRSKKLRAGTYRVVVQSKARKSSYRRSAPPTVVGVK